MRSKLLVTSPSNLKMLQAINSNFLSGNYKIRIVKSSRITKKPKRPFKGEVVAIGGGSVIDMGKLLALPKACIAIPTNACGAAMTSHAVVWTKKHKRDIKTPIPKLSTAFDKLPIKLSKKNLRRTITDCFCHCFESFFSKKATDESRRYCTYATQHLHMYGVTKKMSHLIDAGNWAGRAIEITGTNFIHAISYVFTLRKDLCHADALMAALNILVHKDSKDILGEAKGYMKFYESSLL